MVDESIRRAVCEACGWRFEQIGDAPVVWAGIIPPDNGHRYPWSDNGDAIAALEAWRKQPGAWRWDIESPSNSCERWDVILTLNKDGDCVIFQAADLPTAACEAIAATWSKMKEREDG